MMRLKTLGIYYLLTISNVASLHASLLWPQSHQETLFEEESHSIQALASLVFHTQQRQDPISDSQEVTFSEEEISLLWDKVSHYLHQFPQQIVQVPCEYLEKAYLHYYQAKECTLHQQDKQAQQHATLAAHLLLLLWEDAIEKEDSSLLYSRRKRMTDFEHDSHIPYLIKSKIRPYLIPSNHPMKPRLDGIFLQSYATANSKAFRDAGFITIDTGPRSFIHVARHPLLPGYLVKAYLDTEKRKKYNKASWEWLVLRCEGAYQIRSVIQKYKIKHFVVAKKWIYPIPLVYDSSHKEVRCRHHLALLLVTDMNLVPNSRNYYAWYHYITTEHLNELYTIISHAKGSSYRPDNISYNKVGKFAFIDTEYPSKGPDFISIRKYLSPEMQNYWSHLIRHGGI